MATQKMKYGFWFLLWAITFFLVSYLWIGTSIEFSPIANLVLTILFITAWFMCLKFMFKFSKQEH